MSSIPQMFRRNSGVTLTAQSLVMLALGVGAATASAGIDESIENALKFGQSDAKYGQIKFDLRYRYEYADSKNPQKQAGNASTARLRLGYLTPKFYGFQLYSEYEGNQDIVANDYNSLKNGKTGYETIADPQQNELNQFWIDYTGIADTSIKVGRQNIALDNHRFIGDVDWRQMQQTFDAVTITNKSLPKTTVQAGYLISSRDIVSDKNAMDSQFVNVGYDIKNIGKLSAYTYLLDYTSSLDYNGVSNSGKSNQTYGARFDGGATVNDNIAILYTAEYAYQEDFRSNPNSYQADYYHIMGGLTAYKITGKVGMEQLGGKATGQVFQTPLSTLHAFNGWADQFLTTPKDGLRDIYGAVGTNIMGVKLEGIYHDFHDDTSSINYGQEWDAIAVKKFGKHYMLLGKYAYYDDKGSLPSKSDTHKFWLQAGVSF